MTGNKVYVIHEESVYDGCQVASTIIIYSNKDTAWRAFNKRKRNIKKDSKKYGNNFITSKGMAASFPEGEYCEDHWVVKLFEETII